MSDGVTRSRLAVLLFTDIVGSTDVKSRLGSAVYLKLLERHNQMFESLCAQFIGGEILKHTGDGYFATFATASDAVRFALLFQHAMRSCDWNGTPLTTRIGIHIGEVGVLNMAGKKDVSGLAADLAARVMSLAQGGQILLTREAFNNARQFISEHPSPPPYPSTILSPPPLKWLAHGQYLFKGSEEPLDIFEVGADGFAPLHPPDDTDKAKRVVPHEQEQTLGWRPGIGLDVPNRVGWRLERKLGEGGFGEVWLAQHDRTKQRRVFKFCFDIERLRSFKRELTLFRLLRDALGDRPDIAKLYEVKLDEPPFFLESEYTAGGNLSEWAQRQGGIDKVPLGERLELLARVADAVAAAHSVGILHKDIKPSNILIHPASDGGVQPRLSDFGIGILTDPSRLQSHAITQAGFTQITLQNESSRTGTRMYSPPESLTGKPFSIQGDVYALGVLLYQMVIGSFEEPLAPGWERNVSDPLLRDDIAAMVEGDAQRRLSTTTDVSRRLRNLPQRRRARRLRRLARLSAAALVLAALLSVGLGLAFYRERALRLQVAAQKLEAERQKAQAEIQESQARQQASIAEATNKFLSDMLASADPDKLLGDKVTVLQATEAAIKELDAGKLKEQPLVEAAVRDTIGNTLRALARYDQALPNLQRALELRRKSLPAGHPDIASSLNNLANLLRAQGRLAEAEPLFREALEMRRQALPAGHPHIAASLNNLAVLLSAQGKLADAEPLYREALEMRRKALPAGHPHIAASLNSLANLLQDQGRLADAEPLFREALEMVRQALPAGHPHIATSLNNLASLLQAQGKLADAEPLFREALEMWRQALPAGHPLIATSLNSLAGLLQAQGKLDDAEPLYREALEMVRQALPAGHPHIAQSLNDLASLLQDQGRLADAEPLLREALEIFRHALPAGHRDIATTLNNLARLLQAQGKLADAEPLFRQALEIDRQALPAGHPDIATSLNNLAGLLRAQGRLADAEPLFRQALEIDRQALPAGHPHIAASLNNLARLLRAQGKLADAEPLYREALEMRRKALPAGHPHIAASLNNLARLLHDQGKLADAERLFREALEIRKTKFGAGGAPTTQTAAGLARVLDQTARPDEAVAVRREFGILELTTQPTSKPDTATD